MSYRNLFLTWVVVSMSSCVLYSTQLETIQDFFQDADSEFLENKWLLSYKDQEVHVYAVDLSNGTLFSNKSGDQVFFDGWVVTQIKGLGDVSVNIKHEDLSGGRTFFSNDRYMSLHVCEGWLVKKANEVTSFFQKCKGDTDYLNTISLNKDGRILSVKQVVDAESNYLNLTKAD